MSVSVVVPVFNGSRYLPAFYHSLRDALPEGTQLIFVDDASTEPVFDALPQFGKASETLILRNEQNLGYSAAVNQGFAACKGQYIVQLNTDLVLDAACITSMVDLLRARADAGIVGSKLLYPTTGLVQHIGMALGNFTKPHVFYQLPADHPLCCRTRPMQILTGATVAMTQRVLDRIGPLEEGYFNNNEDLDHCLRAVELGLVNYTCAESLAYHWVSQSGPSRFARLLESDALFWATWYGRYQVDLDTYVDEALRYVLHRQPMLATLDFEALNLSRGTDDLIVLGEVGRHWPDAVARIHRHRQMNNADWELWLPMLLPYWMQHHPRPFIYVVDHFRQLDENRLWFQNRLRTVREEIIIDVTGCAVTASELLGMQDVP